MTDYISATPDPVAPGGQLKICYDFAASGATGWVGLTLDYDPDGVPDESIQVHPTEPCRWVTVPQGADGLIIEDVTGASEAHAVTVAPK